MVGSPGTQSPWPMAAAADGYRNRTTRRSKALKGTAQGVHQLAPSPLAAPAQRAGFRTSASVSLRQKKKVSKYVRRSRPVFKVHAEYVYRYVRVRQGYNNNKESTQWKPHILLFSEKHMGICIF